MAGLDELSPEDRAMLAAEIRKQDPVVKLHSKLYGDPEARKDLDRVVRKHIKLFPDAVLPDDPGEVATAAVKPLQDKIAELEGRLEQGDKARRYATFRQQTIDAGADPGEVDEIHKFMLDNEFGPKALPAAVEAFHRSKETAEPNATGSRFTFEAPGAGDPDPLLKQILGSGPGDDLHDLTVQRGEQIFREMAAGARR